ncbi:hypothetical protein Tco_1474259 [Tanacetum coccineum]
MNFVVVRSSSPYNGIIGRPGVRKLQAVPSTTHGMLKILVEGGVITLKSSKLVPWNVRWSPDLKEPNYQANNRRKNQSSSKSTCGITIVEPKNTTVSYRGSGAEKGTYETKSYASFNDKQTGSYGRATVTEKASSGDFHGKNGTNGTRNEYKRTETVRYGDKSGCTEVYNERRVRDVSYKNNYGGKNVVSYDSGTKSCYGGGSGGGYGGGYDGYDSYDDDY